ncbi:MAG: gluconokinase [Janthinobacterium lividum]
MPVAETFTSTPLLLVVMGVSGSGKTTVAAQLAGRIGLPFVDGDDLHPKSNVAKMHAGVPLDDDDRWPWLDSVAATLAAAADGGGMVLACSALKHAYRDRIRGGTAGLASFAFLDVSFEQIAQRLKTRVDHFMPPNLLQSQFATLERPGGDEADVMTIPADGKADDIVAEVTRRLGR